jgi:hypothetical protein
MALCTAAVSCELACLTIEPSTHDCNRQRRRACAADGCRPADGVTLCSVGPFTRVPDDVIKRTRFQLQMAGLLQIAAAWRVRRLPPC